MTLEDVCEMRGCERIASRITSTETKYIFICDQCWNDKYRI